MLALLVANLPRQRQRILHQEVALMEAKEKAKTKVFPLRLSEETRRALKVHAAETGTTMAALILGLIDEWRLRPPDQRREGKR